jgi:holo-[acyl-carrier protein] synthase
MGIVGIGTEIVECFRIRRMIEEHGEQFLRRIFTEEEIRFCQSRRHATEHFAARWAAKEAVFKALGVTGRNGLWTDVETQIMPTGSAKANVGGATQEMMETRGIREILLTVAFCRAYATATAIAVRK